MTARPADVDTGFWLWLAALPLLLAGQLADTFLVSTPAPVDRTTMVVISALLAVILAAVVLTMLFLMREGYRWARTVLTAGGVATIVYTAVSLFGVARPTLGAIVYAVTGIIGSVLIAGGVFALHRPDSQQHFVR
ncbi:MAG: hypothetical protein WCH82_07040 [Mycobacteriaceae bacterium]